jgi:hypothetical protein
MTLSLYIDPDGSSRNALSCSPLFVESGEYAMALRGLSRQIRQVRRIPDSLFLEIYAYETLERLRELAGQDPGSNTVCWMPFWPCALFRSARIDVHPAIEVQGLFPDFGHTTIAVRSDRDCEHAAKIWLGRQHVSWESYRRVLYEHASAQGWEIQEQ